MTAATLTEIQHKAGDLPDGDTVLSSAHDFLGRFVAYPSEDCHVAHTLWIAHAHLMDAWESTPRLAFLSVEAGSGKTRALEVSELLVPHPIAAINATPAYLFRKVSDPAGPPTILFDEIDTIFGPKAKDNEEIRGVLNAGHRRGAMAGRCIVRGKVIETEELPAYCAVAVAGKGSLPDTILSRSVIIQMRRRSPDELIEPYRRRLHAPEGYKVRDDLIAWTDYIRSRLTMPEMPEGVEDRNADVWEALLSVADAAGGNWPRRARLAAIALVAQARESAPSLGLRLLSDLKVIFGSRDHVSTDKILTALCELDEAPWGDFRGRPIDPRNLANLLRPYGVRSKLIRDGATVSRGYSRDDLHDPWVRYLTPVPPAGGVTTVTSVTTPDLGADPVADVTDVTHSAGATEGVLL